MNRSIAVGSGVARGGAGGATAPLGRNSAPPLAPQMKFHFVQRSMESRHFESRSAPPAHPSAPLAAPSFWKVWLVWLLVYAEGTPEGTLQLLHCTVAPVGVAAAYKCTLTATLTCIHTLRVQYAHAAANLNSGYSKYMKVARVHYYTIALRTSRAVLTRAWASRRVDLRERRVDLFSKRVIIFCYDF